RVRGQLAYRLDLERGELLVGDDLAPVAFGEHGTQRLALVDREHREPAGGTGQGGEVGGRGSGGHRSPRVRVVVEAARDACATVSSWSGIAERPSSPRHDNAAAALA